MTDLEFIRQELGTSKILEKLAKEATELGKAALKYRLTLDQKNPIPATRENALKKLREEIADVENCLVLLSDLRERDGEIDRIKKKHSRWIKHLGRIPQAEQQEHDHADEPEERMCSGRCTGTGYICPHLTPDFRCRIYDTEE